MSPPLSRSELKRSLERKAYALGVSPVVSCLLAEHFIELLIHHPYVGTTNKQLVQDPARSN